MLTKYVCELDGIASGNEFMYFRTENMPPKIIQEDMVS